MVVHESAEQLVLCTLTSLCVAICEVDFGVKTGNFFYQMYTISNFIKVSVTDWSVIIARETDRET
jgi:hypothetical protein